MRHVTDTDPSTDVDGNFKASQLPVTTGIDAIALAINALPTCACVCSDCDVCYTRRQLFTIALHLLVADKCNVPTTALYTAQDCRLADKHAANDLGSMLIGTLDSCDNLTDLQSAVDDDLIATAKTALASIFSKH